jgi:hypothetical protein
MTVFVEGGVGIGVVAAVGFRALLGITRPGPVRGITLIFDSAEWQRPFAVPVAGSICR